MSIVKLASNLSGIKDAVVNAAKGTAIKSEAHRLENSTLTSLRRLPTAADKLKHFATTKSGLKSLAPSAALYGGAALGVGAAAKALTGKKND